MSSENIKGIQQRLHELNAEETRLLADVQVYLAGIERIHAQRRIEELTLVELQSKAENDRREREDKKPRTKQEKKGKQKQGKQGQARNEKRGAEEQLRRAEPSKRQRRRGLNNGGQGEQGIPVPIPGPSNQGNRYQGQNSGPSNHGHQYQGQNQTLPDRECKCPTVNIHCGGSGMCAVCKALGCGGIAQSHYRDRKKNSEDYGNVPGLTSSAAATWPNNAASVINIDVMDSQG